MECTVFQTTLKSKQMLVMVDTLESPFDNM